MKRHLKTQPNLMKRSARSSPDSAHIDSLKDGTELEGDVLPSVFSALPNPVFVKDERFRFVFVNDAFCRLMGRPRGEMIGRTDFDLVAPEEAAVFRAIDTKMLASGESAENEEALTSPDGVRYWMITRKSLLAGPGRGRCIVGIMSNITERKRIETELVAAKAEAEESNRAKSQFLANMSHELRTPLNAVIGFSEIIKNERLGTIGEPRYRHYAEDIHRSGVLLLQLINDILDLTKIEAGKYELVEEECDLSAIASDGLRAVRDLADHKGTTLQQAIPCDFPFLFADPRAIKQIVASCLSNAVKFTPTGGVVEVVARLDAEQGIVLTVTDTGIGMAEEDIPSALGKFRQLEGSWSRKHSGTGLGLPLVKALIKLHSGRLRIESALGRGTTVVAHFPASRTVKR
jgi:PAS domain S-box-containing protein